jgi:hypothetical protein
MSFCGSSRRSRTPGSSSASADVTLAMGGNLGGMAEGPEEDCGRPSEAVEEVSGKNEAWAAPDVAPLWGEFRSGIGEEGFEFPRRWNLRWESIVAYRVGGPNCDGLPAGEEAVYVWSVWRNWRVTSWGLSICKAPWHTKLNWRAARVRTNWLQLWTVDAGRWNNERRKQSSCVRYRGTFLCEKC